MAQSVEHVIGNDEVISSILITSSKIKALQLKCLLFFPYKHKTAEDRVVSLAENLHFDKSASIAFVWINAKGLNPNP